MELLPTKSLAVFFLTIYPTLSAGSICLSSSSASVIFRSVETGSVCRPAKYASKDFTSEDERKEMLADLNLSNKIELIERNTTLKNYFRMNVSLQSSNGHHYTLISYLSDFEYKWMTATTTRWCTSLFLLFRVTNGSCKWSDWLSAIPLVLKLYISFSND